MYKDTKVEILQWTRRKRKLFGWLGRWGSSLRDGAVFRRLGLPPLGMQHLVKCFKERLVSES
jgi:hypothetical protein